MVATRRQIQKGPEDELVLEQDPDLILKKKPVRKATVKTTTKPDAKPKTTRSKQAEFDDEPEVESVKATKATRSKKADPEAEAQAELAKPAVRKPAGRAKKETVEPASVTIADELVETANPTRSAKAGLVRGRKAGGVGEEPALGDPKPTRTGTLRGRRAAAAIEDEAPPLEGPDEEKQTKSTKLGSVRGKKATSTASVLPPPEEQKPARQTRGAAAKPQPLSPKKITQVSKAQTRTTRNVSQKPAAKAAQLKGPAKGRATGKKRTVSDENAEIPEFDMLPDQDDDVVLLSSTPIKTRTANNRRETAVESEASMSSRPTTPNDSPARSLDQAEEEDEAQEDEQTASDEDVDLKDIADASEDELCGPKTPMKRSSAGAELRYHSSVQRTIRKYDDLRKQLTPARRFAVLGTQRGTPQTQKPYCKPVPPASDVRPMTVARGTGRAFVFKDLSDGAPALNLSAGFGEEEEDPSFLPDEDIIPLDEIPLRTEVTYLQSPSQSSAAEEQSLRASVSDCNNDLEDGFVVPADVQKVSDDPDDTIVLDDMDDSTASPTVQPGFSFENEDTVIITRPVQTDNDVIMLDDVDESEHGSVIFHSEQASSVRTSQVWQKNIRQVPIEVNFDEHLSDARLLHTEDEGVERDLSLIAGSSVHDGPEAVAGAETEFGPDLSNPQPDERAHMGPEMEIERLLHDTDRRQTVNLNDFIDVAALAEPTETLNITQPGAPEEINESSVADAVNEDSMDDLVMADAVDGDYQQMSLDHPTAQEGPEPPFDSNSVKGQSAAEQDERGTAQEEGLQQPPTPRYALPTLSSERRKSLPAFIHRTPVQIAARPNTSDGSNMPRIANPFANQWGSRSRAGSTAATPLKSRPSTAHGTPGAVKFKTPARLGQTQQVAATPVATPNERYPVFAPRQNYADHARTVAAPVRFQTPLAKSPKRRETFHKAISGQTTTNTAVLESEVSTPRSMATPQATPGERYPLRNPRQDYDEHAKTVVGPVRFQTPSGKSPKRRETFHMAISGHVTAKSAESDKALETPNATPRAMPSATPTATPRVTTSERYRRLRPQQDHERHAKTVAAPIRFQTPAKSSLKRPATVQKAESLRKAALKATTNTPVKTPLKAPAMTPSQAPMTPHPAAPLRGVFALVEVFTLEGGSASAPFIALLHRLGAKTTRSWSERVTHVVFKDGSPTTLQRVRLNNKDFEEKGTGAFVHCVNSRWVTDSDTEGTRMDESSEAYAVDAADVPRGGKRRRKSMEPSALLNLGGNVVRDRKSSLGRVSSLSRSPLKFDSLAKEPEVAAVATPKYVDVVEKENSGDEQGSPATPVWIAAPGSLVQQTAPMKRVRMLDLQGKEAKNRRLTCWNAGS